MIFNIGISYSQICVFDATLVRPYNDWLPEHVEQGFAYRPGSVSFATQIANGQVEVDVQFSLDRPDVTDGSVIIKVPFQIERGHPIEVGSIMDGVQMNVDAGQFALYFFHYGMKPKIRLIFVRVSDPEFSVIKAGSTAAVKTRYSVNANPA